MRYLIALLLAGCADTSERQVFLEHPTKKTHAEFNADWRECEKELGQFARYVWKWPSHSHEVSLCMGKIKGWRFVEPYPAM